ncbi:ImmA/IrrE family metallo-endopeptidase [Glutamicibacter arilaitensis]|uniref:ImmA/IrrE family metallo-endopeptidase n=1 Tax=Micrococcaceae TaxID=1268 RepID=UPI00063D973B|nr:ImmA/IrrE family metallo-endopeptidase [Arthrobacter sp. YC-RL1]ALQ32533.1 XRE family transcriptional regulator [Arthrobacter sp. YC-RL1]KLI90541.1 XRE family transcriptional regulator [Arthrobacter sp. YC-RL1]
MFNPSRLKQARQRLALTLTMLAKESGVSLRSLTNYESGKLAPSEENLVKLANTLSVPRKFFERDAAEIVPVEAASFRKLSKTTAATRDAVLASASLAVEFFEVIESKFRLPIPDIPSFDKLDPSHAAELVRHRWNFGDRPIPNMLHLLESKGVRVAALHHEYTDIDAFCFMRDNKPYVFLNTSRSAERQRFDLAHELGHLVLHGDLEMDPSTSKEREIEANRFAASFLMPGSCIRAQSMRGASIKRILAARSFWKVSAMAMTHRLHELGLLSDWQYRSNCMTLSELGYRKAEPGGIVPEASQLLRKVMFGSTNKVSVSEASTYLDLYSTDVRDFVRNLVPVAA